MKMLTLIPAGLLLLVLCCSNKNYDNPLSIQQKMNLLTHHLTLHLQSETERDIIRKHNIRSASFVKVNDKHGTKDSTTFIEYDTEGRVKNLTTSRCNTLGCTLFKVRQQFHYTDNKIQRFGVYTFNRKYKWTKEYWMLKDTSELSLFHWENFSYNGDTTIIKSSLMKWKYVINNEGKILNEISDNNTRNKIINAKHEVTYLYSDSTTSLIMNDSEMKDEMFLQMKVKDENTFSVYQKSPYIKSIIEVKFNDIGLISEEIVYENDVLKSITKVNYSYE